MRLRVWSGVGVGVVCGAVACLLACVSGRDSRDTIAQRSGPVSRLEPVQESDPITGPTEINVATLCVQIEVCELNRDALPGLVDEQRAAVCDDPLAARMLRGDLIHASSQRADIDACVARLAEAGILRIACKTTVATTSGQRLIFQPLQDADAPVVDDGDDATETRLQLAGLPTELCVVPTVTGTNHFLLRTSGFPGSGRMEADSTADDDRPLDLTTELRTGEALVMSGKVRPQKQSKSGIAQIIQVAFRSQPLAGARPARNVSDLIVIVTPTALDTQQVAGVVPRPVGGSSETGQRNSRWLRTLPQ